jgi:GntR family transcriptional regulator
MLSAVVLEGESLKLFRLEKPVPAFRVEGVSFCGKDLIIEMEDSIYRGDIYRFAAQALPQLPKKGYPSAGPAGKSQ